jgi:hypothetical protein
MNGVMILSKNIIVILPLLDCQGFARKVYQTLFGCSEIYECAGTNLSPHFYEDEILPKNDPFERSHTVVAKFPT